MARRRNRKQLAAAKQAGTLGARGQKRLQALNQAARKKAAPKKKAAPTKAKRPLRGALKGLPKPIRKMIRGELALQKGIRDENMPFLNPTQQNPFGEQTVSYDEYGNPIVNQELSPEQQQILEGGQQITRAGQGLSHDLLNQYQAFDFGNFNEQRSRIENDVFGRLTQDTDQREQEERAAKEQELYNKGIPFSNDPNSRYQQELTGITKRYDQVRTDARQRASEIGGQELERQYGIDLGQHQQFMGDISSLQQQGTGLMLPSFQGYQGATIGTSNPSDLYTALEQLKQNQQGLNLQGQQIANQNSYWQGSLANQAQQNEQNKGNEGPPISG